MGGHPTAGVGRGSGAAVGLGWVGQRGRASPPPGGVGRAQPNTETDRAVHSLHQQPAILSGGGGATVAVRRRRRRQLSRRRGAPATAADGTRGGRRGGRAQERAEGRGGAPGMSVSARVQKCPATSAVRGTVRDGGRRRGGGGGQRRQRSTVAAVTGPHACATQRGHRPLPAPRPLPARRPHPARLLVGGEVLRPRGRGWGERDPRGRPPRPLPPRPPPARLRFPFRVVAAAIVVGGAYPHWRPGRRRRRPPHQTAADAGVLSQQRARASHDDCRRGCAPAMQGVGEG